MDNYIYILGQSGSGKKKLSNEMASLEPVTRKRAPPPLPENKDLSKALVSPAPITRSRAPLPLPENKDLLKASQEAATAPAEEEKPLLTVTSRTRLHTDSGEAITIQYFVLDNFNNFSKQAGLGNTRPFKPKLSKASQEAVHCRHLLLKNEKKKDNI